MNHIGNNYLILARSGDCVPTGDNPCERVDKFEITSLNLLIEIKLDSLCFIKKYFWSNMCFGICHGCCYLGNLD